MHLGELHVFPVKSLRGLHPKRWTLNSKGLAFDRHYMLIDNNGRFVTQRQIARLALVDTALTETGICVAMQGEVPLTLKEPNNDAERIDVTVWHDTLPALHVSNEADDWFSEHFGQPLRLVSFADDVRRSVDPNFADSNDQTGFSDGFPLLLIGDGSLADLSERCGQQLDMIRFRPNLVAYDCPAFAEDGWQRIRIGTIEFRVVKPCSRCIIPTIDPKTGERGKQPMQALLEYRRRADKRVYFGQNLIHDDLGELAVGMPIEVLA